MSRRTTPSVAASTLSRADLSRRRCNSASRWAFSASRTAWLTWARMRLLHCRARCSCACSVVPSALCLATFSMSSGYLVSRWKPVATRSLSCSRRHSGCSSASARNCASFWSFFWRALRASRASDWCWQKVATACCSRSPDSPSSMASIMGPMSPTRASWARRRFMRALNPWWMRSSSSRLGNRRCSRSGASRSGCCSRGRWKRRSSTLRVRTCERSVWKSSLSTSWRLRSLGLSCRRASRPRAACQSGGSTSHSRSESSSGPRPPCTASHDWLLGLSRLLVDRLELEELPELLRLVGLSSTSTSLLDLGMLGSLRLR